MKIITKENHNSNKSEKNNSKSHKIPYILQRYYVFFEYQTK